MHTVTSRTTSVITWGEMGQIVLEIGTKKPEIGTKAYVPNNAAICVIINIYYND